MHREKPHDAVIVRPLDHGQKENYREGKKQGHSDTSLFFDIFPKPKHVHKAMPKPSRDITIDIGMLHKEQLIQLIEKKTRTQINGLSRLDRDDLESLVLALNIKK